MASKCWCQCVCVYFNCIGDLYCNHWLNQAERMVKVAAANIASPAPSARRIWCPHPVAEVRHMPLAVKHSVWPLSCSKGQDLSVGIFCAGVVKSHRGDVPMPSIERESMGAEFCTGGATTRLVAAWARIVILEAAERVVPRVEVASDVNPQGYVLPIKTYRRITTCR
jgi:hypothetical protein